MELKSNHPQKAKEGILQILFESNYEMYMHGRWMGPHEHVTKTYSDWKELLKDIDKVNLSLSGGLDSQFSLAIAKHLKTIFMYYYPQ